MEVTLEELGALIYTGPSILIIFLLREGFRNWLFNRITRHETGQHAAAFIDPLALGTGILWGISWGGINQKNRHDNAITFIFSQLLFYGMILVAVIYYHLKLPADGTYLQMIITYFVIINWNLALVNWLPVPPFDASYFIMQRLYETGFPALLTGGIKLTAAAVIFLFLHELNFFKAAYLTDFLGMTGIK